MHADIKLMRVTECMQIYKLARIAKCMQTQAHVSVPSLCRYQMEQHYQMSTIWGRKIVASVHTAIHHKLGRDQIFKKQVFPTQE